MRIESLKHAWALHRHAIIPAIVALALCIPGITQGALATDTAWYTAISFQAFRGLFNGDFNGLWSLSGVADQPYFNKPPLAFWLNGLPLVAMGPTILASRIGSVLACILCVLAAARLGRLLVGRAVGLSAGLVLALTWEFIRHSHAFSLDLWMTLFLTLAACSVVAAHAAGSARHIAVSGIWLGLALLVKPLVPLLAVPLLGAWLCTVGRARWIGWLPVAVVVSIAVAAPWHASMWLQHGEAFTSQYFGREIIDRAAAGPVADFNKGSVSPLYYLGILFQAYWPWIVTFAFAMVAMFRREGTPHVRSALFLSLCWCAGWLLLLSIFPDKRPRYLLVTYPVAAVASAAFLCRLAPVLVRAAWLRLCRWALPLTAVLALAIAIAPVRLHRPEPSQWPALYAWLLEQGSPPVFAGGFAPQRSAQVFLGTGAWPIPTRTVGGQSLAKPLAGSLIIYHRRDGLAPGPAESIVFSAGDLSVTRLDAEVWMPILSPDTGE